MSQPASNQDWPAWITAACAAIGVIIIPFGLVWRRITNTVTREEFELYLKKRDDLSDTRHVSNTGLLGDIRDDLSNARERLSAIEGEMKGRYP